MSLKMFSDAEIKRNGQGLPGVVSAIGGMAAHGLFRLRTGYFARALLDAGNTVTIPLVIIMWGGEAF
jgi:hypothetical protein